MWFCEKPLSQEPRDQEKVVKGPKVSLEMKKRYSGRKGGGRRGCGQRLKRTV